MQFKNPSKLLCTFLNPVFDEDIRAAPLIPIFYIFPMKM